MHMPKVLSQHERDAIKESLKKEAAHCLHCMGVKKTTVDELVRRVNIPKGTFYLFYASKELLFFEVLMDFHDEVQAQLIDSLIQSKDSLDANAITEILFKLFKQVDDSFLATLIQNNDLELLIRKLDPDVIAAHEKTDDMSMERFLSLLPVTLDQRQISVFSAALRAIFFSLLHKQEIGVEVFDDAIKAMLGGIVSQILEKHE